MVISNLTQFDKRQVSQKNKPPTTFQGKISFWSSLAKNVRKCGLHCRVGSTGWKNGLIVKKHGIRHGICIKIRLREGTFHNYASWPEVGFWFKFSGNVVAQVASSRFSWASRQIWVCLDGPSLAKILLFGTRLRIFSISDVMSTQSPIFKLLPWALTVRKDRIVALRSVGSISAILWCAM